MEWPTLAVALAIYGGFALVTWFYHDLPWWLVLPLGAYLVSWHGSLQHEVVHSHPTPWPAVNEALVFPSLWLWLPHRHYRETHLRHHRDPHLTDPLEDPESYYAPARRWARYSPATRGLLWVHNTVAGRLLLGPAVATFRLLGGELGLLLGGDGRHLKAWALHLPGAALVLFWAVGVCGIPLLAYLLLFAYPGVSLTLLRSFLEHRAHGDPDRRTAIVEAGPVMRLLYLNNNLHVAHHDHPGLAWYRLPDQYRREKAEILARNGGYRFSGYGEVVARYLLWAKEPPVYPAA